MLNQRKTWFQVIYERIECIYIIYKDSTTSLFVFPSFLSIAELVLLVSYTFNSVANFKPQKQILILFVI